MPASVAGRIWVICFLSQLAMYLVLLFAIVTKSEIQVPVFADYFVEIFTAAIFGLGILCIYAISRHIELSAGQKWMYSLYSCLLFAGSWSSFTVAAMFLSGWQ